MENNLNIAIGRAVSDNAWTLSYFTVILLLVTAAIIDVREGRIPDKLVVAGIALGLAFSLFDSSGDILNSIMGGMASGLVLLLIYYITKGGLGLGDVKLFGCVGVYLGISRTVSAMLIAAVLSGLFSLALICVNRDNRKRQLPFAPFILVGALAAIFF
jgi:prepilin signal peptidase PulO-like enzyme (type II secretory pathway)